MRFCLLTTFFPPQHFGGDAVFVASLANLLAAAGHHVEVVHCADSFNLLKGTVPESPFPLHRAVKVHTLQSPAKILAPLTAHCLGQDWFQRSQLNRIFEPGFDVIHWHNASLLGAPAAFQRGRAVKLMTLHEYWLICPSHILFRNGEQICTNRTCLTCTMNRGRPPQLWRHRGVIDHGLEAIDLFLAPSQFVQKQITQYLPNLPISVLPHFLPDRAKTNQPREDYYLTVARLEKAKGVQTLIPLFQKNGRKLKIAGAGTLEGELRSQAQNAPNIEFLGRVPAAELPSLYARAKATIVPSICHETFGLVVLESLQQGTPVYCTPHGALPEFPATTVFHSTDELGAMLGHEQPAEADLTRYSPQAHLQNYLAIIAGCDAVRTRLCPPVVTRPRPTLD